MHKYDPIKIIFLNDYITIWSLDFSLCIFKDCFINFNYFKIVR